VKPGDDTRTAPHAGALFWMTALAGWALIGYGVRGLLHHHINTRPANLATFVVGGALFHDLIFAPVVLGVGAVVARVVPGRIRAVVQGALIVSGCLALFSYPLVRDYAIALHNPSSLPHNYTANLALVLGIVWAAATILALVHLKRHAD
jgi:hypothetical protein